jgi:hypothetical protein
MATIIGRRGDSYCRNLINCSFAINLTWRLNLAILLHLCIHKDRGLWGNAIWLADPIVRIEKTAEARLERVELSECLEASSITVHSSSNCLVTREYSFERHCKLAAFAITCCQCARDSLRLSSTSHLVCLRRSWKENSASESLSEPDPDPDSGHSNETTA